LPSPIIGVALDEDVRAVDMLLNILAVGSLAASTLMLSKGQSAMSASLHLLLDEARKRDPALFEQKLGACDPFRTAWLSPNKAVRLATVVDVKMFGERCVALQKTAKRAYHRTLLGFLPVLGFAFVMTLLTELGLLRR
jgi:hypothetical protein